MGSVVPLGAVEYLSQGTKQGSIWLAKQARINHLQNGEQLRYSNRERFIG